MTSLKSKFASLKSLANTRKKYGKVNDVDIDEDPDDDLDEGPIYKHKVEGEPMDLLNRCCCILFFILFPTNVGMCILIALLQFSVITFDDIPGFGLPDPTPAAATTTAMTPKAPAKA